MIKNNKILSAFPQLHSIDGNWQKDPVEKYAGMSLMDYFAAKALPQIMRINNQKDPHFSPHPEGMAEIAYKFADAMLKERKKYGPE